LEENGFKSVLLLLKYKAIQVAFVFELEENRFGGAVYISPSCRSCIHFSKVYTAPPTRELYTRKL